MLKLLDWYIIKRFLLTFVFALGLFSLIAIFIDISEKIDDFIRNKPPLSAIIFDYYIYFLPWFFGMFGSIFVFLACIFFNSKLAQNTEIIAMLNSGMNYRRFLRPYFIATAFLALIFIILNTQIIPNSDKHKFVFEERWINEKKVTATDNIRVQISPGTMLHIESFNYLDSIGYNLSMERIEGNKLTERLFASKLKWNKEKQMWSLENYRQRLFVNGKETLVSGMIKDTVLPIKPDEFIVKTKYISSMTNPELNEYIRKEREKGSAHLSSYYVELYKRTASPFSFFVLTLLAVGVSSRKSRGGTGLHLGIGTFITFALLLSTQVFNTFGITNVLPPAIAVWLPNIIFLGIGIYVAYQSPK
ncbi:MAG: LptF/LptG family permease [Bacteroidia bacterium]|nr:LptF/LptG family permease [Bacteroidia bacterium]